MMFMVNADLNEGCDISITQPFQEKKDRHYLKVNQQNKGTVYFKIFHQTIRGLKRKSKIYQVIFIQTTLTFCA